MLCEQGWRAVPRSRPKATINDRIFAEDRFWGDPLFASQQAFINRHDDYVVDFSVSDPRHPLRANAPAIQQ
jgi:hypothetical protein